MSELNMRFAEGRDIPRLLALLVQVNNVHAETRPDLFLENKTKYEEKDLQTMLGKPEAPIFVAEDAEGFVRGYLFAVVKERSGPNLTGGRSFYIDDLCVEERCRSSGVGRALLEHAGDYARSLGCREIILNVWEGNEAALRFYTHNGFTPRSHLLELAL